MASGSSSSSETPLLYACIAHNTTILTEHAASASSQASSLPALILPKIDHAAPQKLTFTHGAHHIHLIALAPSELPAGQTSAGGLTFLVVAAAAAGRRVPFGFLVELRTRFLEAYPPASTDFSALPAYGAAGYNTRLKELMQRLGSSEGQQDALGNAQREIENVRGIMSENIERVLERGERIDLLVDKTDRLGAGARDFRLRSRGLRRRMWWKNVKLMVLLGLVAVFLVYLFVGFGCGLPSMFFPGSRVLLELTNF